MAEQQRVFDRFSQHYDFEYPHEEKLLCAMTLARMCSKPSYSQVRRTVPALVVAILALVLAITVGVAVACEPMARFVITNDTNQRLDVFVAVSYSQHVGAEEPRVSVGSMNRGEILKPENILGAFNTYLVIAKDAKGDIVYSKESAAEELDRMRWRVTISKSQ